MMASSNDPRPVTSKDITPTAQLWFDAWHESHAPYVPQALIEQRTLSSFETRLSEMGGLLRVAGPIGAPIGMCSIKPSELYQLFVAPAGRGTGVAAELLHDGEQRLLQMGYGTVHLDCLTENDTAIRFYSRNGWVEHGEHLARLDTSDGPFDLKCLIFRKELSS